MEISLPGQLRGPECRRVITQAVALRKLLVPWFQAQCNNEVEKLTIILRIDGSLGSFGQEGIENIRMVKKELVCDVVITDAGWARLHDGEIRDILRSRVFEAIGSCLDYCEISYNRQELNDLIGAKS